MLCPAVAGGPLAAAAGANQMRGVRRVIHAAFTPLARGMGGVNPNTLTLVSIGSGILAGVAFSQAHRGQLFYALAAALAAVSGSADALDGIVARLHNRVSKTGEFLDHFGDRIVEVSLLAGIAVSPGASTTFGLATAILVALHTYLGTQIEATFGRREHTGPGRSELFIGFIIFGIVMAASPGLSLPIGARRVSMADAGFAVLAIVTATGLVHRLRIARSLSAASTQSRGDEARRQ